MRLPSIPEYVMKTGSIMPYDPRTARADISERNVMEAVRIPVGRDPGKPADSGVLLGSDAAGRPVRAFEVPEPTSTKQALRAAEALKSVAALVRARGLASGPLISGPLASLAAGEAIVLRWTNGVTIQAAL